MTEKNDRVPIKEDQKNISPTNSIASSISTVVFIISK